MWQNLSSAAVVIGALRVNPDMSGFENELIRIHTVFHSACKYIVINGILQMTWIRIGEKCSTYKYLWHGEG